MDSTFTPYEKAVIILGHIWEENFMKLPNDSTPYFTISNVSKKVLYQLYPDYFQSDVAELLKTLTLEDFDQLDSLNCKLIITSALFSHHPKIEEYKQLYKKYYSEESDKHKKQDNRLTDEKSNSDKLDAGKIAQQLSNNFLKEVNKLREDISDDLKIKFNNILIKRSGKNILEHSETLFFTCVYFYNMLWDADGLSFNGNVTLDKLSKVSSKNHVYPHYRMIYQRTSFLANMFYDYYHKQDAPFDFSLTITGKKPHISYDPTITSLVISSLIDRIKSDGSPLVLDYLGIELKNILNSQQNCTQKEFLTKLFDLANLKPPTFENTRRVVVREYCLEINKVFSHYLDLPLLEFAKEKTLLYNDILKLFNMDDFSEAKRKYDVVAKREDTIISDRLGSLLRGKK